MNNFVEESRKIIEESRESRHQQLVHYVLCGFSMCIIVFTVGSLIPAILNWSVDFLRANDIVVPQWRWW